MREYTIALNSECIRYKKPARIPSFMGRFRGNKLGWFANYAHSTDSNLPNPYHTLKAIIYALFVKKYAK
jgi:hypothetical protein